MRGPVVVLAILATLLLAPLTSAEFGEETADGWPIGEGGLSHRPTPAMVEHALSFHDDAGDPLNQVAGTTLYPYYPILVAELQRLAADHPDRVKLHVAGQSTLGLDIYLLEIADFDDPDAVPLADREVVMIDGGTHSNEYSGVYFVLAVAQYLIEGYGEDEFATWVVENRHTWILPMLNPDGSNLMGRLNANLVNVNRNYPVLWGGDGTDMLLNNPGPAAASEAETRLSMQWMETIKPDYHGSIHCCGNLWLAPYGEEGYDPIDLQVFETVCDEAYAEVRDDCGPIWSTIYPASGSTVDTCYEHHGAVCFGFEMSGRSNLVGPWGEPVTPEEVFEQERESWEGVRYALENAHLYGAHLVLESSRVQEGTLYLQVRNDGYGNATDVAIAGQAVQNITAGASTEITVPWSTDSAAGSLTYAKRIMAAPQASLLFDVTPSEVEATPPLPAGLLLAALVAVAFVMRRR